MSEQADAVLYSGPMEYNIPGRDTVGWRWFLNGHEVVVEISKTALEVNEDALSERVREARHTLGESEIRRMIDWDVPNPRILLTTDDD